MNNTDTPQQANPNDTTTAFGAPAAGSDNDNLSVEDAFFGTQESETPAESTGQPADNQETSTANEPYEAKNDDKRFEYWQSQAAKKDNELKAFKGQVQQAMQKQQMQAPPQQQSQAGTVAQDFPPPPPKPEKPRGFNRQEAWEDPNSDSARYLDDMDNWNESINQYRDLRSQYDVALVREQLEAQENVKRVEAAKRQQYYQNQKQRQEIYEHVQGHYGLNGEEAAEFINTMSDPGSISMDNLVSLYRMNKGQGEVVQNSQGPSEAFQQSKNAQQVPSPMGVMPAQTPTTRSDNDQVMDDLIADYKKGNPWG